MLFVRLDRPCWNFHRMSFRETRPTAPEFPADVPRETRPTALSNPPSCFTLRPDIPFQPGRLWRERFLQTPTCSAASDERPAPDGPRHPFADDAPSPPPTPDATGTRFEKQAGGLFDGFRSRKPHAQANVKTARLCEHVVKQGAKRESGACAGWAAGFFGH